MTIRSTLLGLLVVALMATIQPWNDLYYGNTYIQGNHFPIGAVFVLSLLVLLINPMIRLFRPRWALARGELLTVWCIIIVGMSVPGSALLRYFYTLLVGLPSVSGRDVLFQQSVMPNLPAWLFPATDGNAGVIQGFIFGAQGVVPYKAWLGPVLCWLPFLACLFAMMFFLTAIFHKQWVENERLAFPLVQLPLEMCQEPQPGHGLPRLLRTRAFWVGAAIPAIIHGINGASKAMGATKVPIPVPFLTNLGEYFKDVPGLGWVPINIYFSVIAVGFLLTLETTFSLWFFFVFWMVESAVSAARGSALTGYEPFTANQQLGAYVVFMLAFVWQARRHLLKVLHAAVTFRKADPGSNEMMSYPAAVWGLVLSIGGMAAWNTVASSGGLGWAVVSALLWVLVLLVLTRIIAQTGLLFVQCNFASPYSVPSNLGLTQQVGVRSYAVSVLQGRILWDIREVMMPNAMNSMKIASESGLRARKLLIGMALALIIAFACASLSQLKIAYTHGTVSWADGYATRVVPTAAARDILARTRPSPPPAAAMTGLTMGVAITAALSVLRNAYFWWPLAPVGLLVAGTYPLRMMWFSIFAAWLLKWLVMRYGGGQTYRAVRNGCLGMLMADALMAGVWMITGLVLQRGVYAVLPG